MPCINLESGSFKTVQHCVDFSICKPDSMKFFDDTVVRIWTESELPGVQIWVHFS